LGAQGRGGRKTAGLRASRRRPMELLCSAAALRPVGRPEAAALGGLVGTSGRRAPARTAAFAPSGGGATGGTGHPRTLPGSEIMRTRARLRARAPSILMSGCTQEEGAEFDDYSLSLSMGYPRAVLAAGGLPWLLPCQADRDLVAEAVRRADGVLL